MEAIINQHESVKTQDITANDLEWRIEFTNIKCFRVNYDRRHTVGEMIVSNFFRQERCNIHRRA